MAKPRRKPTHKRTNGVFGRNKPHAPAILLQYYPQVPTYEPHHHGLKGSHKKAKGSHKKAKSSRKVAKRITLCLIIITFLGSIILGVLIVVGCMTPSLDNLFLVEMSVNKTYDINMRVGCFGGCLSVAGLTAASDNSTEEAVVHCVVNMRPYDPEDLGEKFWEDFNLSTVANSSVREALNVTLPHAVNLQTNVFSWPPSVLLIAFFVVSGIILLVALTATSHKPAYKASLLVGSLFGTFALGLALTASLGSAQALNALLPTNDNSTEGGLAKTSISAQRGNLLIGFSNALVALITIFYVVIGAVFVGRGH